MIRRLAALGAAAALLACGAEPLPPDAAPATPRASLLLEPLKLGVGQVSALELAVVAPPGHVPHPYVPPAELPGLWLLSVRRQPVERQPGRWVHRTELRVRAREVGRFSWPAGEITLEAPDGTLRPLPLAPLEIEVASVLEELPDRLTPYGLRAPPPRAGGGSFWGPAGAGALAALTAVGLIALARRRRSLEPGPAAAPEPAPWQRARAELARARERAEERPVEAAHATARALRRYLHARFGADTTARTTEELAATEPPFAVRSRWPGFLAVLRGLDALRFLPADEAAARGLAAQLAEALDAAQNLVESTVPPEERS